MITHRPAASRGHANHGWLDAWHSFSFADYHDPEHMGWGVLRVLNDDTIAPGMGFGTHGHRDMEIVTYVLEGALEHRDSLGNGEIIRPGEVQRMGAGRGVMHSEFNPSPTARTHLLQIWLLPAARGLPASYEQVVFSPQEKHNRLCLIASPNGGQRSVTIHQDARLYAACPEAGVTLTHTFEPARLGYVHVIRGALALGDLVLGPGDGAKIADESALAIEARAPSEFLLFDLPPDLRG